MNPINATSGTWTWTGTATTTATYTFYITWSTADEWKKPSLQVEVEGLLEFEE